MTAEEITLAALFRALEFTNTVPSTRSVLYRRIGVRQQQLFARAASVNADYFGICATGGLDDGAADLGDFAPPVEAPESITRVEIADPGSSPYDEGTEIRVVPSTDVGVELPPRMTLRNRVLRQVSTDLAGVLSIRVAYSRVPLAIGPADGAVTVQIPAPHDELLVVDLTKTMLTKGVDMDGAARGAALELLATEEAELLLAFDSHVASFAGNRSARFGSASMLPRVEVKS